MKFKVIALSIFLLSSCSSVFYSQNQKIDLRSNGENNTEFIVYDEQGNIYPKPLNIRSTSTPGGMSLFIPKFSQFRYKSRFVPRVNYLLAKKNESNKVYKVNYRMRYDGSRFEPYATFGITSTAAAALTVATIPIALATDGGILIPAVFALLSAAGVIYVDLPTGIISEIYSWILSRQGVYRKWKFVSIQELDPIDYPDFLSSYRFEEGESLSATEKKKRPSNRMKRLVSTYNQKVKSNDSTSGDANVGSKSQEIPNRDFSFSEMALDSTKNQDNSNSIDSSKSEQYNSVMDSVQVTISEPKQKEKKIRAEGPISGYYEDNYADKVVPGSSGYYLVSGIYRSSSLANRMKDANQKKNIVSGVFRDKKNNMFYLFLMKFDNPEEAEKAKASGLQNQYRGKLWIKIID